MNQSVWTLVINDSYTFKRFTGNQVSFYNSEFTLPLMYAEIKNNNQLFSLYPAQISKNGDSQPPVKAK